MPDISIKIRDKIAQTRGDPEIICGNSDYTAVFDFDAAWSDYEAKTARFVWRDILTGRMRYKDTLFTGSSVSMPVVYGTYQVLIGVYAGEIRTTTPAVVPCTRCITDDQPAHDPPTDDVYEQLLAYLAQLEPSGSDTGYAIGDASVLLDGAMRHTIGIAEFAPVEEDD